MAITIKQLGQLNHIRENIFWNSAEDVLLPKKSAAIQTLVANNIHAMNSTLDIGPWAKEKFGITLTIPQIEEIGRTKEKDCL